MSDLEKYQAAIDKSIKLESLQAQPDWEIVNEVMDGLLAEFAADIMNDKTADYDKYKECRAKIDGIRAVKSRMDTILKNGKQASDAIAVIGE